MHKIILAADFNCNIFEQNHSFSILIRDLMGAYGLMSAFDIDPLFDPKSNWSRCCMKRNSYSLLDGFLISRSLLSTVTNVQISYFGDNTSDHYPVRFNLNLDLVAGAFSERKL
jgi:hypothetical protein